MPTFVRFERNGRAAFGLVHGSEVQELHGGLFDAPAPNGKVHNLDALQLLAPCTPPKILAVGLNYRSHLGNRPEPANPEIFYKPTTSLQNPNEPISLPLDAQDVHFEGELVIVIGQKLRHASPDEAAAAVFGVTCGNDVSDRNWQRGPNADRQWWRAKGCDTFAPLGPWIVTDIPYDDLALQTRVNGETLQQQRTSDLIFRVPETLAFISRYLTLHPGDVLYTGTPGNTRAMKPGDVVEIEIEKIGVLRNPVRSSNRAN